jgi:NADPH:quinone reductase-like Zn-dependent oxidoreductase
VQSGLGPCSSQHRAGARVIATCREAGDQEIPARAGADEVLLADETLAGRIKALADEGVDHVIEVALGANIKTDVEVLAQGGSIATYATDAFTPEIPFWQLVFGNAREFSLSAVTTYRPRQRLKPRTLQMRRLRQCGRGLRLPQGFGWMRLRKRTSSSNTL